MHLTIANLSKTVSSQDFQSAVRAIARQVAEDFFPEWGIGATLSGVTTNLKDGKLAPVAGHRSAIIYVGESSNDPTTGVDNALGYHSDNHKNVPYGFIYLDVCKEAGENWTVTLSHEVLELLADPTAVTTITGKAPHGKGSVYFDLELKPFGVRPLGYLQYEDHEGPHQIEGQDAARAMKLKSARLGTVRRNSRRQIR